MISRHNAGNRTKFLNMYISFFQNMRQATAIIQDQTTMKEYSENRKRLGNFLK